MILGKHTLDETRDLLAVADYRFRETGKAFDAALSKPQDLVEDWTKLQTKWKIAREEIASSLLKKALLSPTTPANIVATEPEWITILSFIQGQELVKGSLQDITRRIEKLTNSQILYPNQPKQDSKDVDTQLFGPLDTATKQMDAAAEATKNAAKNAVTSNTGLIIGGTIVGTLAAVVAAKVYLKI